MGSALYYAALQRPSWCSHQHSIQWVSCLRLCEVSSCGCRGDPLTHWAQLHKPAASPRGKTAQGIGLERPSALVPSTPHWLFSVQQSIWGAEGASQPCWEVDCAADGLCSCMSLFVTDFRHWRPSQPLGSQPPLQTFHMQEEQCHLHSCLQDS